MLSDDVPDPAADMRRIARGIAMTIVAASMAIDAVGLGSPFDRPLRPMLEASASSALDVDGDDLVWRGPAVFPDPAPHRFEPSPRPMPSESLEPRPSPLELGPSTPPAQPLGTADIEAMAKREATAIANCWRRARKGTDDLLLADIRKVTTVLTIDPSGAVTGVGFKGLPPGTKLEGCLATTLRQWIFRTNAGSTLAFTMVPPS